ncbi:hypothetical protein ACFCYF_41785 [Streptomyces chartreusis]|uniref:hypothetical protein n=1 Tax=Streptomyces chartreusis TaxID=1969 RepID=UPI0035DBFEA9
MTTLALIVVLTLGGVGVYAAYNNPKLGAALAVGVAIVTALYLVLEKHPTVFPRSEPPPPTTSTNPEEPAP